MDNPEYNHHLFITRAVDAVDVEELQLILSNAQTIRRLVVRAYFHESCSNMYLIIRTLWQFARR